METSKSQSTIPKLSQTSQSQSTQLNHRIDDSDMSENDLIANGLYYLDPEQMKVYNDFTSLLSSFDNFDMVSRNKLFLSLSLLFFKFKFNNFSQ